MDKKSKQIKSIYFLGIFIFITGCTPGPPPPPLFPGFEWLIIALAIFLAVFLWKRYLTEKPLKTNYLTDALNAINQQLKILEKKIDELEKKQDQEKNNKN